MLPALVLANRKFPLPSRDAMGSAPPDARAKETMNNILTPGIQNTETKQWLMQIKLLERRCSDKEF